MNPDGTMDLNLRSYHSGESDGKTIDEGMSVIGYDPAAESLPAYTGALKFTGGVHGVTGQFGTVIGGSETACDCNNGARSLTLSARVWDISRTKYGFTNKGGCRKNRFAGLVRGHGSEVDFDQDNWSDQSHKPCSGTRLALTPEDGRPLRVRYIYEQPVLEPGTGPYRFVFPWPWLPVPRAWIGRIFNQLRRWGFFK